MEEKNQNKPANVNAEPVPQLGSDVARPQAQLPPPNAQVNLTYAAAVTPTPQTNVWAIISLVSSILGWLGLFGLGGIIGVIAGVVARNEIAASRGTQTGDGLALTGIILGAVNIAFGCLIALCAIAFVAVIIPFTTMAR
jgi:hypothetical protein